MNKPEQAIAAAPTRAVPRHLLALLMAMTAIGPVSMNILIPALPGLVVKLGTDVGTVQLTLSLYLVGLALSQLLLGSLSDRFGRRPVVLAGLSLTAVACIFAIAAASIEALIAARIAQAFGASTGMVIGRAIVRDLYDRERAAAMLGWVITVMVVAPMVAPLIGGLLDTAFGWKMIFAFMAVLSCGVLAWTFFGLPETRPHTVTSGGVGYLLAEMHALVTNRSFLAYMLCATFGSGTFFCFLGGAPFIVVTLMERSSAEYGGWFIIPALGYMAGNSFAGQFSRRFGIRRMIAIGVMAELAGATASLVLMPHLIPMSPLPLFLAQMIITFGNGVLLPNALAGAISVRPQAAGAASGITGCAQWSFGAVVAQTISMAVTATLSAWSLQFAIFACALALLATLAWMRRVAT
ncbi:MAG: multidrug effflux MFS transporter [Pseudorhodoplanes sp.]